MALAAFYSFSEFPNYDKEPVVRNVPTEMSGSPPEVIPNIPVGRNGPFHLHSGRNFRNLWHNGKHPFSRENRKFAGPFYREGKVTSDKHSTNDHMANFIPG